MIEKVSPADFHTLRDAWDALYETSAQRHLFSTHAWLSRWLEHFGTHHAAVVVRSGERIDAAAVLGFGRRVCRHLGDHTYWPEIIHRRGHHEARRALLAHLREERMGRITLETREDDTALARDARGLYEVVPAGAQQMHAVDVKPSYARYLASLRRKIRGELRRKRRRLDSRLGEHELRLHGPEQAEDAMASILAIERASWKEDADTAIVSETRERSFYRDVLGLEEAGARGRAYLLLGRGVPRAFVLGVVHEGCFYALKTSYRAEDAHLSPGQVLFARVLEQLCAEEPVRRLELLGRDARWKRELATHSYTVTTVDLLRHGVRARALKIARIHLAPRLKRGLGDHPRLERAVHRARDTVQRARALLDRHDPTRP